MFSGLRHSITCVYKTLCARRFVREHRLQLDQAAHHGGVGISVPNEPRHGIPYDSGFGLPIHSLIVTANLLSLIYWLTFYESKV